MKLYYAFAGNSVGQTQNIMTISSSLETNKSTSQSDSPFVTIILPLDYESEKTPYQVLEELIGEVKNQLNEIYEGESLKTILKKLNRLIVKLPPQNLYKGVIAFLSDDVEDIIPVNYEVSRKASIGENFDFEEVQMLSKNNQPENQVNREESNFKDQVFKRLVEFRLFGKKTY
jgi:hypothetical protein